MTTDHYDLTTRGRDHGHGTLAEGTVTKLDDGYHFSGASERGIRFGCYLDVVYVDYLTQPTMEVDEQRDVSEMEFRLGDGELHLR